MAQIEHLFTEERISTMLMEQILVTGKLNTGIEASRTEIKEAME